MRRVLQSRLYYYVMIADERMKRHATEWYIGADDPHQPREELSHIQSLHSSCVENEAFL